MTMVFRTLKAAVVNLLGTAAGTNYRVIGYQDQGKGATEVINDNRTVQVWYTSGAFPKSSGSLDGPAAHDVTLAVELMASKAASVDLATLNNPASTPAQRATALANARLATSEVDDSIDELIDLVYNELQDARNQDLGLNPGDVANRWIGSVEKGEPNQQGEHLVITAVMNLGCRVSETFTGATPVSPSVDGAVLVDLEVNQPDSSQADAAPAAVTGGN